MTSWNVMQVAAAVFIGNMMTLGLVRAYQKSKASNDVSWLTIFYVVAPCALAITVLLVD